MAISNQSQAYIRSKFFEVYKLYHNKTHSQKLDALDKQLLTLIHDHPEYHAIFADPEKYKDHIFSDHDNPFLHLGLHMTLLEQVSTNRPKGITQIYKDIMDTMHDPHHAEHHIMDILSHHIQGLVTSQKTPDEKLYLKQLKKLLKRGCGH